MMGNGARSEGRSGGTNLRADVCYLYRPFFEAIKLIQRPVHGDIADEVVDIIFLGGGALLVRDKGLRAREAVVRSPDRFAVPNCQP